MLRTQMVDLWKSRVQYLRQYYCFRGHKPKLKGRYPTISYHVWFIPFIVTSWWLVMANIFLCALKIEHFLNTGDIFSDLNYMSLISLLGLLWWKFAITQSDGTHLCKDPHCACPMCINYQLRNGCKITHKNISMVILPLGQNMKCFRRRRVYHIVQYSDHQVTTPLLLILGGDIEINPGPDIELKTLISELAKVKNKWYEIGIRLDVEASKLDTFETENKTVSKCLIATLRYWLDGNTDLPVCWESIISALSDPSVDEPGHARMLQKKFCKETPKKDKKKPLKFDPAEVCYLAENDLPHPSEPYSGVSGIKELPISSVLEENLRIWPPDDKQTYLAHVRKKTKVIKSKFNSLFCDFRDSLLKKRSDIDFLKLYYIISESFSFDESAVVEIKENKDIEKLLDVMHNHQSFIHFENLINEVIPKVGTDLDKESAKEYIEEFKKYAKFRVFECKLEFSPVLANYYKIIFIIDENHEQYKIEDLYDFRLFLGDLLGIKETKIILLGVKGGSVVIHVQIPYSYFNIFEILPLYPTKFKKIKDKSIKSYKFEKHEVMLQQWEMLTDVTLHIPSNQSVYDKQGKIVSAQYQGENCTALLYPNDISESVDIEYIKYLEVLFLSHKEVPSIKGLYYPPTTEEGMAYPVIITEKLKPLKDVANSVNFYEESEVNQISLLLSIARCMSKFERLGKKLKILMDNIVIQENDTELEAKFLPIYGHSYIIEHSHESEQCIDMLWIRDVLLHILSHGEVTTSIELPDSHLLKNIIEQKWLSKDVRLRPPSHSVLADNIQHLLETEKTLIALVKISTDDLIEDEDRIHVILIGHTGVGKTSLRKHLKNEPIDDNEFPTIVMEPEFLYRESMGIAFKPLLDLPSESERKVFLTMWDTGGQPIFQDLLPCFARLKSLYGIVFRLSDLENFDQHPKIRPYKSIHLSTPTLSPFTNREIMYRNLSFVQAFSCNMQEELESLLSEDIFKELIKVPTGAIVVGTCKDQVRITEELSFQERTNELNKHIGKFAKKYEGDLSIYPVQEHSTSYIHEVDNTKSGKEFVKEVDPGIESLRNTISSCAKNSRAKIPRSWQVFRMALQRMCYTTCIDIGILPLQQAISIGKDECNVEKPEAALMYFHQLGVFMWYHLSNKRTLRDYIVIDPKTLIQVLATWFSYDPESKWSKFTRRGMLPMDCYRSLLKGKSSNIDDLWFMEFLEEHHLSIKVNFMEEKNCYFVPSILPIKDDYTTIPEQLESCVAPLYIVPESNYIATGMFTRLLTALAGVTYGNTRWKIPLNGDQHIESCRNQFEFLVNGCIRLVLTEFSQYIRVDCLPYNEIMSKDTYSHIVFTLNVQLQRIVPHWLEKQEFNLTLVCNNSKCSLYPKHFYLNPMKNIKSNTLMCSREESNELMELESLWFRNDTESSVLNNEEVSVMIQEAMKSGSLDMSVATVVFVGTSDSLVTSAKHIALQEQLPTTLKATEHEIYFRVAGQKSYFKKMETHDHDDIIAFTSSFEEIEDVPTVTPVSELKPQSSSFLHHLSVPQLPQPVILAAQEAETSIATKVQRKFFTKVEDSSYDSVLMQNKGKQSDLKPHTGVKSTMQLMRQCKSKGKVEVLQVIDFGENFSKLSEILKIFIKNVSLYAFVTNLSEKMHQTELDALMQTETPNSSLLIIGTNEENAKDVSKRVSLYQIFGSRIVRNEEDYVFCLNLTTPQGKDYAIGSSIINHAMSATKSKGFPLAWYTFGFKLREFITSSNLSILSVSEHCMEIGKELNMDRPTVEAALEHLTEHNMILYFKDILANVVFSGIAMFSRFFSSVHSKLNCKKPFVSVYQAKLQNEIQSFINGSEYVSENDILILLKKLMIIAPFQGSIEYIIPVLLQPLNESERQEICKNSIDLGLVPVIIRCPTSGNEFISMLISSLLNQSWNILESESGVPVCLHKNCATLRAKDANSIVTITFRSPYIEVYVNSDGKKPVDYHHIASTILRNLEKIKITLNSNYSFSFNIGFYCNCGKTDETHTCTYNCKNRVLVCEKNKDISRFPLPSQRKWLGGEEFREPLTISNGVNLLLQKTDKWIELASSLGLPNSVIDTIIVSCRNKKESALRKTVEWWFMNSANPEWDELHRVLIPDDATSTSGCYSARLYSGFNESDGIIAIFCMCSYYPAMYIQECDKRINERYRGVCINQKVCQITSDEVVLKVTDKIGWNVTFDEEPAEILKRDIDISNIESSDFPPTIIINLSPDGINNNPPKLLVTGLEEECYFGLPTPTPISIPIMDMKPTNIQNKRWIELNHREGMGYGKWLIFKHYDELDRTWEMIKTAILSDKLKGCKNAKCSTIYYDPTRVGPGPCTSGVISVYTERDNMEAIGFELIKLIQHDLKYKTNESTKSYKYSFIGLRKEVASKTIYWNNGKPSFECVELESRGTTHNKEDIWHLNIVNAPESLHSEQVHGKWILYMEYQELTGLWHLLKEKIESKEEKFQALKMECPPKHDFTSRTEKPRFFIFTSKKEKNSVGKYLIEQVKRDIQYECNEEPYSSETLYWNGGKPAYEIIKDWQDMGAEVPTEVHNKPWINLRNEQEDDFGKWMVFKHYDEIDRAWEMFKAAVLSDKLPGCRNAKCSTMYYDPHRAAPGPCTSGVICAYTKEDDIDVVGFELIKLFQHDIKYKTNERSDANERTNRGVRNQVSLKTIYWNNGRPSFKRNGPECPSVAYDREDIWHINIVNAPEPICSEQVHGKWILSLEYNRKLTDLWHFLKDEIESRNEKFQVIKMECPPKCDFSSETEKPRFFIFTNEKEKNAVGKYLIEQVKRDIRYEFNERPHSSETLYWNDGEPAYEQIRRRGITRNWRTGEVM